MNTEKVKELIATTFLHRGPSTQDKYNLGIFEGKLVCISYISRRVVNPVFATVSLDTIHRGFTGLEWERIAIKIIAYCERNKLCLKDLTH